MWKGTVECAWHTSYFGLFTNGDASPPSPHYANTPVIQTKQNKITETRDGNVE